NLVDRDDVWVVQVGHVLGLTSKALQIRRQGAVPGAHHLEGNQALWPLLLHFVDDAHAPAPELFEALVLAEGGRAWVPGPHPWQRRLHGDRHLERLAKGIEEALVLQERPQRVGQVRVASQQFLGGRGPAGVRRLEVIEDDVVENRRCDLGAADVGAHVAHHCPWRSSRSPCRPRLSSPATDFSVRSASRAIWSTGSPRRSLWITTSL